MSILFFEIFYFFLPGISGGGFRQKNGRLLGKKRLNGKESAKVKFFLVLSGKNIEIPQKEQGWEQDDGNVKHQTLRKT